MPSKIDDQLLRILSDHDREIGSINTKISDLTTSVHEITNKMEAVLNAVTTLTARPTWALKDALDIGLKMAAISAVVVGLITFVASERYSSVITEATSHMKETRTRIEKIEGELSKRLDREIEELRKNAKNPS